MAESVQFHESAAEIIITQKRSAMGLNLRAIAVGPLNAFLNLPLTQVSAFEK